MPESRVVMFLEGGYDLDALSRSAGDCDGTPSPRLVSPPQRSRRERVASHPDLQAEQAYVERAYQRVDELRAQARERLESALRQRGGTPQAMTERDMIVRTALHRIEQLDLGGQPLCFGRIDFADGQSFYLGRLAVSSADQEPLVVDWRAPVAEPFYRATGRHPMGLSRRRHFSTEGRRVVNIEDEVFSEDGQGTVTDGNAGHSLVGPGALLAALERSRSGQMRDIVATVQREQDEVIRSELAGALVVQGGPGTGKTAVALHRAAYLLYTHRFPLERQGVLVVGPNRLYLSYVEHVLPSLGETGVVLTTVEGLVPGARVRAVEGQLAARVKGDARMAEILARAVHDRERPLRHALDVGVDGVVLRLGVRESSQAVAFARRRAGTHNARRRHLERWLTRHFEDQYSRSLERRSRLAQEATQDDLDGFDLEGFELQSPPAAGEEAEDLWPRIRRLPQVAEALDRMWPLLAPEELLHDLYGASPLLELAGGGRLDAAELAVLHRDRSSSLDAIPWTAGDLAMLDEARVLLGPRRLRPREEDEIRTYGHIVVDEAQDLTAMQLRMLARRSLSGSMTVVGDIAQATGPSAPDGWEVVTAHLPRHSAARVAQLSVNYRTPGEVMDVASRVLAEVAPHLRPPLSARSTGVPPTFIATSSASLATTVAEVARREMDEVRPGTTAVIAADSALAAIGEALDAAGVESARADRSGLSAPITLLAVGVVKGLEFDSVVVVEPAVIVDEEAQGLRALYVALTRPTRRLTVVHAGVLPGSLADSPSTVWSELRGYAAAVSELEASEPRDTVAGSHPRTPEVGFDELASALKSGALVVDVRMPDEYAVVHVPGAVLIPLPELATRAPEVAKDRRVYVICASGGRSLVAAEALNKAGWDAVSVAGGTKGWASEGRPVSRGPAV
ncbi:MAG TPA: rhodanese-like domain-containing protein [Acidimicrobiales bacterium]|nr:rhodanese-like domain-containing protein [Acidimicrobiales bacterium]